MVHTETVSARIDIWRGEVTTNGRIPTVGLATEAPLHNSRPGRPQQGALCEILVVLSAWAGYTAQGFSPGFGSKSNRPEGATELGRVYRHGFV